MNMQNQQSGFTQHHFSELTVNSTLYKKSAGFTLVEMLVSIAIFVTSITSISAIFMYANRSQRATEAISEVQSDARFAMEVMAQQIRRGSVDYSSSEYGGEIDSNPQDVLVLRDSANNQIWFKRALSEGRGIIQMSEDGNTWYDISPSDINVNLLKFYIFPLTNPFLQSSISNNQPLVTIIMSTSSNEAVGQNLLPTFLQTTVSSRQYVR